MDLLSSILHINSHVVAKDTTLLLNTGLPLKLKFPLLSASWSLARYRLLWSSSR